MVVFSRYSALTLGPLDCIHIYLVKENVCICCKVT